ncbi:shikimate kinase [Microbacterium sp. LRZ72]|uniref:shikimate kinase n=1 Tax=Microbacterium sp. LRZ72 TaxID=2942481 RepID=UPI0029A5EE4E|nr:shikimate kinase [Microbacterium sp. LRZ72]MDX2375380.1 shikimate kinase [Microbacterium sp. LRZ72]
MTADAVPVAVFVGPMGAGKTSVGKRVARALGVGFVDTDKLIIARHGPIPRIFAEHGEPRFREWERAAVVEALAGGGVVSLGGGAVLDARTRSELAPHRVVLLTVTPEAVARRIGGGDRPLIAGEDPMARWQRIFDERRPFYDEVADATFDTSRGPISGVADRILDWVRSTS